jgi:hypothetical protein
MTIQSKIEIRLLGTFIGVARTSKGEAINIKDGEFDIKVVIP